MRQDPDETQSWLATSWRLAPCTHTTRLQPPNPTRSPNPTSPAPCTHTSAHTPTCACTHTWHALCGAQLPCAAFAHGFTLRTALRRVRAARTPRSAAPLPARPTHPGPHARTHNTLPTWHALCAGRLDAPSHDVRRVPHTRTFSGHNLSRRQPWLGLLGAGCTSMALARCTDALRWHAALMLFTALPCSMPSRVALARATTRALTTTSAQPFSEHETGAFQPHQTQNKPNFNLPFFRAPFFLLLLFQSRHVVPTLTKINNWKKCAHEEKKRPPVDGTINHCTADVCITLLTLVAHVVARPR